MLQLLILLQTNIFVTSAYFNPFADKTLFDVTWPGSLPVDEDTFSELNSILIRTPENEQYRCIIPQTMENDGKSTKMDYSGPSEEELLKPLFQQAVCSYRLDTYWTYELCHGRHVRQYHEERENVKQRVHVQEYFLGYIKKSAEDVQQSSTDTSTSQPPLLRIEGMSMPYYQVNYTDGTPCDITNKPRRTNVQYACHPNTHGEIYQLRETSSCEYEIIIFTGLLCAHPSYSPSKDSVNTIQCHSLDGSPVKPMSLESFQPENVRNQLLKELPKDQTAERVEETASEPKITYAEKRHPSPVGVATDKQLLKDFLNGDHCVHGGTGWWRHEFCYGKKVVQYHEDSNSRTAITLGSWDENKHIAWLRKHPNKQAKSLDDRKQIVHYYGDGSYCELTAKSRHVEVKLRCLENSKQPHAISIYLLEPSTCEYTLVVESSLLCSVVERADANGLISDVDF